MALGLGFLFVSAAGVLSVFVRRVAVPDLTTTVLTMTLTGLAADSALGGGSGAGSVRRVGAVVALLLGALAGALLVEIGVTGRLVGRSGLCSGHGDCLQCDNRTARG